MKKEKFNYRDIKDVYIIVFFEKSTSEFRQYPEEYLHYFSQQSDTGLEMELLQKLESRVEELEKKILVFMQQW